MHKPLDHEHSKPADQPQTADTVDPGTGTGGGPKSGFAVLDQVARDGTDPGTGTGGGPKSGLAVEDEG